MQAADATEGEPGLLGVMHLAVGRQVKVSQGVLWRIVHQHQVRQSPRPAQLGQVVIAPDISIDHHEAIVLFREKEIGRASCREREQNSESAISRKTQRKYRKIKRAKKKN